MSCDNLPSNGATTRRIVTRFAALRDRELGDWIEQSVVFPSTMVDRIVPATTDADRAEVEELTGLHGRLAGGDRGLHPVRHREQLPRRPARTSTAAGAQLVDDVEPYERMKLRMLNGSALDARVSRLSRGPSVRRRRRRGARVQER